MVMWSDIPDVGDIVLFVLDMGNLPGRVRGAVVTDSFADGTLNLRVFGDAQDGLAFGDGITYRPQVPHDPTGTVLRTWHHKGEPAANPPPVVGAVSLEGELTPEPVAPAMTIEPEAAQ